jgi:membrane protein implicated in regulation of membrane protease activity
VGDLPGWAAWLLLALVLIGAEALTVEFVLVYFALGALVAAAVSPFVGTPAEAAVFAISSVLLMVLTRRPLLAWSGRHRKATTIEDIAGESAVVTLTVDNRANTGQVRVGGEYWTARTPREDDPPIPPGVVVRIESIAGVTVRVVPSGADAVPGGADAMPGEADVSIPREYQ